MRRMKNAFVVALLVLLNVGQACFSAKQDLVFEGVYEAALDLPRIYFLIKRDINKQPLNQKEQFEVHYAFLDTGASGILLSRETPPCSVVICLTPFLLMNKTIFSTSI